MAGHKVLFQPLTTLDKWDEQYDDRVKTYHDTKTRFRNPTRTPLVQEYDSKFIAHKLEQSSAAENHGSQSIIRSKNVHLSSDSAQPISCTSQPASNDSAVQSSTNSNNAVVPPNNSVDPNQKLLLSFARFEMFLQWRIIISQDRRKSSSLREIADSGIKEFLNLQIPAVAAIAAEICDNINELHADAILGKVTEIQAEEKLKEIETKIKNAFRDKKLEPSHYTNSIFRLLLQLRHELPNLIPLSNQGYNPAKETLTVFTKNLKDQFPEYSTQQANVKNIVDASDALYTRETQENHKSKPKISFGARIRRRFNNFLKALGFKGLQPKPWEAYAEQRSDIIAYKGSNTPHHFAVIDEDLLGLHEALDQLLEIDHKVNVVQQPSRQPATVATAPATTAGNNIRGINVGRRGNSTPPRSARGENLLPGTGEERIENPPPAVNTNVVAENPPPSPANTVAVAAATAPTAPIRSLNVVTEAAPDSPTHRATPATPPASPGKTAAATKPSPKKEERPSEEIQKVGWLILALNPYKMGSKLYNEAGVMQEASNLEADTKALSQWIKNLLANSGTLSRNEICTAILSSLVPHLFTARELNNPKTRGCKAVLKEYVGLQHLIYLLKNLFETSDWINQVPEEYHASFKALESIATLIKEEFHKAGQINSQVDMPKCGDILRDKLASTTEDTERLINTIWNNFPLTEPIHLHQQLQDERIAFIVTIQETMKDEATAILTGANSIAKQVPGGHYNLILNNDEFKKLTNIPKLSPKAEEAMRQLALLNMLSAEVAGSINSNKSLTLKDYVLETKKTFNNLKIGTRTEDRAQMAASMR